MADGRQKAEWYRAASQTAALIGAWGGRVEVERLVPERYREKPAEAPAADDGALGFEMLKHGLAALSGQWKAQRGG